MKAPHRINFLVVDDFESVGKTITQNLKDLGFHGQIYLCSRVSEAKKCLEIYEIHFIISDKFMPEETGIDFLKFIRRQHKYKEMPFLILTTSNEMESVVEAIDEGADNYVIKPWTINDLKDKINSAWVKRHPPIKAAKSTQESELLREDLEETSTSNEKKDTNKKA